MPENPRIEELRRRVQADPASIAFAALAEEFRRVGRYDEAVEACRTGLQRHPAYLSARVTLGRALIETGEYEAAREELETVLRSAPENLAAIRGLAQIHERLGHSAEMDPHLADMMKTLHAESVAVAALAAEAAAAAPPLPEPVPAALAEPAENVSLSSADNPMVPQTDEGVPEPAPLVAPPPAREAATDVFAAFAPAAGKTAAAADYSFDLSPAFTTEAAPEPAADVSSSLLQDLPADVPVLAIVPEFASVVETAVEPIIEAQPEPGLEPEPALHFAPEAEPEPELDPELVRQLATLARLERFLGAIQSLRA